MKQRTKEIGIRKVLSTSIPDMLLLIAEYFLKPVAMAHLIAWPLAYWGIGQWLQDYAFHIRFTPWFFIALLTISIHTWRAAHANPVESLRNE